MIVTDDCHTWTGGYNGDVVEWGCTELPDLPYKTVHEIRRYQHSASAEHPRAVRALLLMGAVMFSGGDDGRVVGYSIFEGRPVVTIDVQPRAIVQALATDGLTVYIGTDGAIDVWYLNSNEWVPAPGGECPIQTGENA